MRHLIAVSNFTEEQIEYAGVANSVIHSRLPKMLKVDGQVGN